MRAEAAASSRQRWVSLAAICTAAGLVWLAFADLGVALPTIADELDASLSELQWANNAFSLVTGALVIAAGKFSDIFGRRRILVLGIVLLAIFSVVPALAPGPGTLIAGRALMGVGAALILPATLALIPPQFSGRARHTAFGVWQAAAWGGQAIGPAVGGVVTDGPGWRWLFWLNLPLAALALLVIRALTPESRDPDASRRVDWPGLVTIGLAVFTLLYALTDGPDTGWASPLVIGGLAASVVLAVAWVLIEQRVREPLVNLRLFSERAFDGALTANLVMNLAFAGLLYLLAIWLQNARGYEPVEAGLLLLPSTLGIFLLIPVGGRLNATVGGRRPALLGLLLMSGGLLLLGLISADSSLWWMALALFLIGSGIGLLSTPISTTAVGDVPVDLTGTAAGVFKMSSMVGGALGVATLSALGRGFSRSEAGAAASSAGLSSEEVDDMHRALVDSDSFQDAISSLPETERADVTGAVASAFSSGVADAMATTAVIVLLATAIVALVWPRRDRAARPPAPVPPGG